MMKKLLVLLFFGSLENMCVAQIPYFAKTVDQDRMYAYTSMKVRPGINSQETWSMTQCFCAMVLFACGGLAFVQMA